MITSKQRAEYRAAANGLDVTLMVGKGGISDSLIAEAENCLESRELVKGKVLEAALMTPREASDAICEATGADGISVAGSTFVIFRKSKKLEAAKQKAAAAQKKKVNPVKVGRQKRKAAARAERERKAQYFHDEAVKAAIEKRKKYYQDET